MKTFIPTAEAINAHTALERAQEAFDVRLAAFETAAVESIEADEQKIGFPIWVKETSELADLKPTNGEDPIGQITGYMFDFDKELGSLWLVGYIAVAADGIRQFEISADDALFEAPEPPKKRKRKAKS